MCPSQTSLIPVFEPALAASRVTGGRTFAVPTGRTARGQYLARVGEASGTADATVGWPTSAAELVDWIEAHALRTLPGHDLPLALHARMAATLARQDGACDALIAAAVLHDLTCTHDQPGCDAWLPMPWLRTLFDDNVLGPLRLMSAARTHGLMGDPASRSAFVAEPHASRALRLVGYDEAARRADAAESALPWSALRPVLQRCTRD